MKHIGKDTGNKQMFEDALRISRKCEKGKNKITGLESLKKYDIYVKVESLHRKYSRRMES